MRTLRASMLLLGALCARTMWGGDMGVPTTVSGHDATGAALAVPAASTTTLSHQALQRPTELQYWDPARADNGYNFFGVGGTSYLLDMEGRVVHTWPVGTNPHLLSSGSVLDATTDDPSGFSGFKEVSWEGALVWSYLETRSTHHPHHDFTRIFNPKLGAATTLYIANQDLTYEQLIAAGADPARTPATGAQMDAIVEVDSSGTIVWEWRFFDHVVQDFDPAKPSYVGAGKTIADYPNKLNLNLPGHDLKNDWLHCNSLDYNQTLDQIVVNSVQGELVVIDHGNTFIAGDPVASIALAATAAGDFLYRFGDPARYDRGDKPAILEDWTLSTTGHKQLGGSHDIHWIAEGLPGAGHLLVFNNAEYLSEHTSQSYVMEIDPTLDAGGNHTGHYVDPPDAGYTTVTSPESTDKTPRQISRQVVWTYASKSNLTLFSQIGSSAQRLPNGNTLVCADTEGYVMEVTPDGDTVWDYIVPVTRNGIVEVIGDNLPMVNSIFRAFRYEASNPAFAGRTLTPGDTIAGRTTVDNPYADTANYQALQRPTETQYWDSVNAQNGYTLFGAQGTTYLLDMQGRVAHTWPTATDPRLLDSGHLLDWVTSPGGTTGLQELDWDGNTVWQHLETRTGYHPHGDFRRIHDPKLGAAATLYLANKDVTEAECLAAGCDPADGPYDDAQVDTIVEVDMAGNVVWEWSFWDHAIQDVDPARANHVGTGKTIADYPGRINLNLPGRPVRSNWLDCNSLDYNQSLDQIVVNSRHGELVVIDHGNTFIAGDPAASIALAATTAGDFLYRFGDPARYEQGLPPAVGASWETATSGHKQMGGSSNAQWIQSGLPGAGHLLVFDNNQYLYQRTPQSYVFEINPHLDSSGADTGSYVNPPTAGYTTWTFDHDTMKANQQLSRQVVWTYGSVGNLTLFSHFGSSAQRLPNGNTLLCATTEGYLVEVDASGNVVWEYINPVTNAGIVTAIGDDLPMTNALPRATRFAADFAGFAGRDLTAGTTITGHVLPTISETTRSPAAPTSADTVWVTSRITDDGSVSSATLTTFVGSGTPTSSTPFTETMGTTAAKPWTGTGTENAWTVTGSTFEQRTGANYGTGNQYGVEYKGGTTLNALTEAMIETSGTIDASGTSGAVGFWIRSLTLDGTDGWTFQLDAGSGYVTRLSELAGSSHGWQEYHYDLAADELVSGLKMRFQFTGGGASDDDRIDLDLITVTVTSGGATTWTVAMLDDGSHADGTAGDHVYGGQIPAMADGTTVSYYITATDDAGFFSVDPVTAPTTGYSYTVTDSSPDIDVPEVVAIPAGQFEMGDHFGLGGAEHESDEIPLHTVTIDAFSMGVTEITNAQYRDYLNSALAQGGIEVRNGYVFATGGTDIFCETTGAVATSGIVFNGSTFSVVAGREQHPMVGVRWHGAAAYTSWLSLLEGYEPSYDPATWQCDFSANGYRLPTEAEWEYAALGGATTFIFPWGNDENVDGTRANWPNSGDPYETGDLPWTTPVGFYNGQLHAKADFSWPGTQTTYQTSDGSNGHGLYDMSGNVWEWTHDWYGRQYYSVSPSDNPTGPATGDPMPDGNPYRVLRGGNWYNGEEYWGHGRVANRNPAYYRGPDDPNHAYYHVGFRVAWHGSSQGVVEPGATLVELADGLQLAEGPAADAAGNVFFSDVTADLIYTYSVNGQLSVFRQSSGGANGLFFDAGGNLVACEGDNGRMVSIDPQGALTVLAAQYGGTRFNEPNDLWIDPQGGIYFSDPVYWGSQVQDGQHVYYLTPDRDSVLRVIDDMVRPNGIIGTPDGQTLYVSDEGGGAVYRYTIQAGGMLANKTLFVPVGADGMTIDNEGNIYVTENSVLVHDPSGSRIDEITVPERPTNAEFGGSDGHTLFITTEHSLLSIRMRVKGVPVTTPPTISGTARTPVVPSATDSVWVTSTVTDDGGVTSVKLTYATGSGAGTTTTPFVETMGSTVVRPWTGTTGSGHPWTVTGSYFELRTSANYPTSTTECGMEFKGGAALNPLTSAMVATTNAINAAATSGYAEFWLQSLMLEATDGWTFQIDAGSGYVTRLSELTGSSHSWQKYHYDLAPGELVSGLRIRFQFTGGGTGDDDRIDLDQITVTVTSGTVPVEAPMLDDGAHADGTAGDHVYGGQIPAMANGTMVSYYLSATDDAGLVSADPPTAPTDRYSYVVGHVTPQLDLNELLTDSTSFVPTTDYPTKTVGLLLHESGAWEGYTLLAPKHNTSTYLVDNAGRLVHSWASAYVPGQSVYLLPDGHLLRSCMTTGPLSSGGGEGGRIEEYDWDGNLVWGFDYSTDQTMQHHDIKPLPNGNVLLLAVEKRTYQEVIDAGFDPALLDPQIASRGTMLPDSVAEIQPVGSSGGNVVWKWSVWDHLIQDHDPSKANFGVPADHPELVDPNGYAETGHIMQFWNHMNSIDYNPELDQILLSVRGSSEVWIIDHSTTTAEAAGHTGGSRGHGGDLLFRWGNPVTYDAGSATDQKLFDQHDAQWIDPGYPGAGHILVFNNGLGRSYSSVDELVPPLDGSGNYILAPGSAYGPEDLHWTYHAPNPSDLYSEAISGSQRLANGNTLICDGVHGVLLEVTSAGTLVWKYVNPEINTGILYQGDVAPLDIRGHNYNAVFKVERYAPGYPAFDGRDLTPDGPLELYRDWIEIHNPGATAVDMTGMFLTKAPGSANAWQVPAGVSIPPGGFLLFWADTNTTAGSRHTSFSLDPSGGVISLLDIDGFTRVDTVTYGAQATDVSYGRYPDSTGEWRAMTTVTPGSSNTAALLTVDVAAGSVAESAGLAATTVTITRNTDTSAVLTVSLASSDTSEATVPATATLPAGQASVTVSLAAVDDTLLDGTQTVTISASAAGFASGSDSLEVTDDDAAELTVNVAAISVVESAGSGATTVTITRNTDTSIALTVSLSSSDTSEATVPATATVPAGQASVTVSLAAVDDTLLDGTQTVTITASAAGFASGSDTLQVTDDDDVVRSPGDVNGDGAVDVADVFYMINYLFAGGVAPVGPGDVDGDGAVNVADVFYLINYLFAGGPAPARADAISMRAPHARSPNQRTWVAASTIGHGTGRSR